jgi:DNA-binding transcriptional regulator LsrR (DeoR family)
MKIIAKRLWVVNYYAYIYIYKLKQTSIMKATKTQIAKDLFFNENLTTSVIAQRLNVSQIWVCRAINS